MLSSSITPLKSLRTRAATVGAISATALGCSGAILAPNALAEPSGGSATQTPQQPPTKPKADVSFTFQTVTVSYISQ
jgi:hypothetical protein